MGGRRQSACVGSGYLVEKEERERWSFSVSVWRSICWTGCDRKRWAKRHGESPGERVRVGSRETERYSNYFCFHITRHLLYSDVNLGTTCQCAQYWLYLCNGQTMGKV